MNYAMSLVKPPTKKELAEIEADFAAERDLNTLLEAAKIRKNPERFKAALEKREKMRAELERIDPLAPAPASTEKT